ncbi:MAG: molybdopterin molybdotransferase [Halieaceae bacterium]
MALTSLTEALASILARAKTIEDPEHRNLSKALGCVLAEQVCASVAVPPDDNSAMDGYALRSADGDSTREITQRITAGSCGTEVAPGTAARIFTGAPVPPGADAVIMQENCQVQGATLAVSGTIEPGQNIRARGQDIEAGSVVFNAGTRLRPQDLGVLASVGLDAVSVRRPLRVAVMSTGDELVEPGAGALRPGQIFNSNRYTLAGLLQSMGAEMLDYGIVPDTAQATGDRLELAAQSADCVITTGGVSVGEEDHVKSQVELRGTLDLWKLRIKPGKPLAFGSIAGVPFFGLPGNPGAVFVTFNLLVRPFLMRCQGVADVAPLRIAVAAGFDWPRPGSREEYLRVRVERDGDNVVANVHQNQSSGVLSSASWSNALAILYPGMTVVRGDVLEVILLSEFNA